MPKVQAGSITMNYEQQGSGEPLMLIPYLGADNACYAFQVPDYAKHFTCISIDLRGTGASDKPAGSCSTEMYADDVARVHASMGIPKAHIFGLSLGAASGMWLAAKYPDRVKSLSLHSGWHKSDAYLKAVLNGWQVMAQAIDNMPEALIQALFPWCFTPELYDQKPDYIKALADFTRSRPKQPLTAFMQQSNAVINHDAEAQLGKIARRRRSPSAATTRCVPPGLPTALKNGIKHAELHVFENCSHATLYENVPAFNEKTLEFLRKHAG